MAEQLDLAAIPEETRKKEIQDVAAAAIARLTEVKEAEEEPEFKCPHCSADLSECGLEKHIEFTGWDKLTYTWNPNAKKFLSDENWESLDANENTGEEMWLCPECEHELTYSFMNTLSTD